MTPITQNIAKVRERITRAAKNCGRDPASITLLAVSKTRTAAEVAEACQAGLTAFGENYLQEAERKIALLKHLPIQWHFIGAIQSNKTGAIARNFDWVQGVDGLRVARRLGEARLESGTPLDLCLQVNVDDEPGKAGLPADEVLAVAGEVDSLPGLRLRGLMAIPRPASDPAIQRQSFATMRRLFERLRERHPQVDTLSMGMSADLESAIAEGATLVRIGTAIFGPRPARITTTAHSERPAE
jgi:PLP dependent protein